MSECDANGLMLSKSTRNTLSPYYRTAVNVGRRKFVACAYLSSPTTKGFSIYDIGYYDDARDAAYIAQEFGKKYDYAECDALFKQGKLKATVAKFLKDIRLPVWQHPAVGPNVNEIIDRKTGTSDEVKIALREAFFSLKKKLPPVESIEFIRKSVESYVDLGMDVKDAALKVVQEY